ncbi:TerB family tellurite resistance protein [Rhodobacteraceae bacterium KMM 6894]|nr:TerB family tellurite resistance protein [Rhodobacteraceae bacterium KMM 6894]
MLSDFIKRLIAPATAPLGDDDARLALTALLVRAARTDGVYDPGEVARIDSILIARYGLSGADAAHLRTQGEQVEAEAPDTVRFTRAIKDAVAYEDRIAVVESLWQVVLADGVRDNAEDAMLRMTASLLGVNDVDSARARQRAEAAR